MTHLTQRSPSKGDKWWSLCSQENIHYIKINKSKPIVYGILPGPGGDKLPDISVTNWVC
jgi:hypothetical protein